MTELTGRADEAESQTRLRVRAKNPRTLLRDLMEDLTQHRFLPFVGNIALPQDPLLAHVQVNLFADTRSPNTYMFETLLDLSKSRRDQPDGGFIGKATVESLAEAMQGKGYVTTLRTTTRGHNRLFVATQGRLIQVNLGYPSSEEKLNQTVPTWWPFPDGPRELTPDERVETWEKAQTNAALLKNKDLIEIYLINPDLNNFQEGLEEGVPILSPETFVDDTRIYAQTVEDIINEFYRVEGLVPPNCTVTIRDKMTLNDLKKRLKRKRI